MEIKGQGFMLRGWRADDVAALQRNADNRNIWAGLLDRFPLPYTMENAVEWIGLMMSQDPLLALVIDIDGEFAGTIGIELRADVYRQTALIGYWLGEAYWGRGVMTEAVKFMADHAFNNMGLIRLQAGVFSSNPASMRVLEKAGFTKEGIARNAIVKNGVVLDEHCYGLVKSEP